jgi:hypothetical protein
VRGETSATCIAALHILEDFSLSFEMTWWMVLVII